MSIQVKNFKTVGLPNLNETLYIDDDGLLVEKLASPDNAQILDCQGAYLSLGWADLHVHVWYGGTDLSIRAHEAGIMYGVTAMADAGSAGEANFHGLREYVMDTHKETIKAFINIGTIGLVACNRVTELADENAVNVERTLKVIEQNRDVICGIKIRSGNVIARVHGVETVHIAKKVANIAGLPLMIHIGEAPPTLDEIFDILTEGDIITHCFHGKDGNTIIDTAYIFERAQQLAKRGILLDIGHGSASLDFNVARNAIEKGLIPYSISTDLHCHDFDGPVYDLATTASKLHALGMKFDDCVKAIANNPRKYMGLNIEPNFGTKADFTIFKLEPSQETVTDSMGNPMQLEQMFEPQHVILGNTIYKAQRHQATG